MKINKYNAKYNPSDNSVALVQMQISCNSIYHCCTQI